MPGKNNKPAATVLDVLAITAPIYVVAAIGFLCTRAGLFGRADMRYVHGGSDVQLDGVDAGEAKLNPVVVGVGLGARF